MDRASLYHVTEDWVFCEVWPEIHINSRKSSLQIVNVIKCCQWPRRIRVSNNTHSPSLESVDFIVTCSVSYIVIAILNCHNSPPFDSTLRRLNTVHIVKICLFVPHLILFCHLHLRLPSDSLPVVTRVVVSTPVPLVCRASWGEGSNCNLVPTPKGRYLLK